MIRAAVAVLGVCFVLWLATLTSWRNPDVDFAGMYSASKLGPSRYLDAQQMRAENARLGTIHPARSYWPRLPAFVAATTPLSALPYFAALNLWRIVSAAALVVSMAFWLRWNRSALVVLAWSLPASWVLYQGQDVGLALLAASASLVITNPFIAGAVLGLAILKWHLFLFVPVVLVARREWRMVAGACASVAALVAVSFVLCPDWISRMIALIAESDQPRFEKSPGLRTLFVASPIAFGLTAVAAGAAIAEWVSPRVPLRIGVALALAAGTILNIHSYHVDCILLLPLAAEMLSREDALERIVGCVIASPAPYLLMVLFGVGAPLRLSVLVAAALLLLAQREVQKEQRVRSATSIQSS